MQAFNLSMLFKLSMLNRPHLLEDLDLFKYAVSAWAFTRLERWENGDTILLIS
jgi:hypothetical protein